MTIQDLLVQAAKTFTANAGSSGGGLDLNTVVSALAGLLSGPDGKIDLAGLLSNMNGSGLMSMAASWLGDGGNEAISAENILGLFGDTKIDGFAQSLDLAKPDALSGLQAALPQIIDQASQGGELMTSLGDSGGLLGSAMKGLFGSK